MSKTLVLAVGPCSKRDLMPAIANALLQIELEEEIAAKWMTVARNLSAAAVLTNMIVDIALEQRERRVKQGEKTIPCVDTAFIASRMACASDQRAYIVLLAKTDALIGDQVVCWVT